MYLAYGAGPRIFSMGEVVKIAREEENDTAKV